MQHSEITRKNLHWFLEQQLDIQLDMLKHQREIIKLVINQLLESEVHQNLVKLYNKRHINTT